MGKHQQDLALFALPPHLGQDLEEDEYGSATAEVMCLLCPNCGFECRGSPQQQREVFRLHSRKVHADVAMEIGATTDAQLLERYSSIVPALDGQTFDPRLLPGSLMILIPDHVRTWQELKQWSSNNIDQALEESTKYNILQAAQYRLMLSTQNADETPVDENSPRDTMQSPGEESNNVENLAEVLPHSLISKRGQISKKNP